MIIKKRTMTAIVVLNGRKNSRIKHFDYGHCMGQHICSVFFSKAEEQEAKFALLLI